MVSVACSPLFAELTGVSRDYRGADRAARAGRAVVRMRDDARQVTLSTGPDGASDDLECGPGPGGLTSERPRDRLRDLHPGIGIGRSGGPPDNSEAYFNLGFHGFLHLGGPSGEAPPAIPRADLF